MSSRTEPRVPLNAEAAAMTRRRVTMENVDIFAKSSRYILYVYQFNQDKLTIEDDIEFAIFFSLPKVYGPVCARDYQVRTLMFQNIVRGNVSFLIQNPLVKSSNYTMLGQIHAS